MPKFKLLSPSGRHVATISADDIESVFESLSSKLTLVTISGKEYEFDRMEYVHTDDYDNDQR